MSEFSIAQAKAQFAQLVHQAEAGQPVRITRRGRSVAVVVSDAEYERLSSAPTPRDSLFDFTTRWRLRAADAAMPLLDDAELTGLRDQTDRAPQADWP